MQDKNKYEIMGQRLDKKGKKMIMSFGAHNTNDLATKAKIELQEKKPEWTFWIKVTSGW